MLWPEPDSGFSPGDLLPITETARFQDTISVRDGDETRTLATSRLNVFDSEAAAREFLDEFREWQDIFARSLLTALPVRALPDRSSTRLYRLRDGEVIKVIGREDETSNEGGLIDYWYNVLTENGVSGWAFGRNLELTSAGGRALTPRDDQNRLDRLVRDISEAQWRPGYFAEMARTGRINLDRFAPRFGLFGDMDENRFSIIMPMYRADFDYLDYVFTGQNRIRFGGTSLVLELLSDERLQATFLLNDRQQTEQFILFDQEINEVIQGERHRRNQLLAQFTTRGNGLVSTAFGSIQLSASGAVRWEGYERLVPDILPPQFDGTASIDFSVFLTDGLRSRYDGVIRFSMGGGRSTAFLYTLTDDGVRFVYLPPNLIEDSNVVRREPGTPVILFFRFFHD